MYVRVRGNATKIDQYTHKLNINIPTYYFNDTNYNIAVRMFYIECDTAFTDLISLQTNLIDKTAFNPNQEIMTILKRPSKIAVSNYYCIFSEYDNPRQYKLQLTALHDSEFFLSTLRPHPSLEIEFTEILLEFTKYARI